jgi:hypothetical protein
MSRRAQRIEGQVPQEPLPALKKGRQMSIRLRTGMTAAGALAFVLLAAAPAAASAGRTSGSDGFTPPYASVRITGDEVENRDFSVRITGEDDSVRITKLRGLDNREFSVRTTSEDDSVRITDLPDNRDF